MISLLAERLSNSFSNNNEDLLYEMANLYQADTNLPMIIWISPKGNAKHGPRIKVAVNKSHKANIGDSVSISISDDPKIVAGKDLSFEYFKLARRFVLLNKDLLIKYWNYEITSTKAVLNSLILYSEQNWNKFKKNNKKYENY